MDFNKKDRNIQEHILRKVEKIFGRGKRDTWKNRDFEDLSHAIHLATKVLISVATLKRLFGKVKTDENYSPHESTIDALIYYADFKLSAPKKASSIKILYVVLSVLALLTALFFVSIFIIDTDSSIHQPLPLTGKIELIKSEGSCPTTAYFDLDIPLTKDSVFLNFGDLTDDKHVKNEKRISHFYAFPGLFRSKIETRNQFIAQTKTLLVPTEGWQSFAYYFKVTDRERYFPVPMDMAVRDSVFHISPHTISSMGIDTTEIVSVRLDNYKKTNVNGDSFSYNASIKCSSFWPAIRCYSTILTIQGELGKIEFKFVTEGCSSYASYRLNDVRDYGSTNDLIFLVIERANWHNVNIKNHNKRVQLIIGGKEIFARAYKKSIGNIVGTTIEFHGSGFVKEVSLEAHNKCLYDVSF